LNNSFLTAYALLRGASAFLAALGRPARKLTPLPLSLPVPSTPSPDAPPIAGLSTELRQSGVENRCPVCEARFRGTRSCSRCGADLQPLMLLTGKAWQLRQAAREALAGGSVRDASDLATRAQGIQATRSGEALRLLSTWLQETRER